MPKYAVLMKCVGFVDVDSAESAEQAMQFAQSCKAEHIKHVSGFYPEAAIEVDDMPLLEQYVEDTRRKKGSSGRTMGRPRTTRADIPEAFLVGYRDYLQKKINISDLSRICKLSRPTVYKYIKLIEAED